MNKALIRSSRINKNLLLLAKIENCQFEKSEFIGFDTLVVQIIDALQEHFKEKNISLSPDIQTNVKLHGNSGLSEVLINNLIINAIRHTSQGSAIRIALSKSIFEIRNSGHQALNADLLFKRFSKMSADNSGSGLGLSIVKEICKLHGWHVTYRFENEEHIFVSGMYGSEKIIDRGDQPFINRDNSQRLRLWQFLEDELKTTAMATAAYQHKFKEAGHLLNIGFNYTFHREDEQYFYDNYLPSSTGTDAFKLLSDEQVYDFNIDYIKPLKYGRIETGIKLRSRNIPTNMEFRPGANSVLDINAGGWAGYKELIPAVYGNYVFETEKWEAELGLRMEYVKIQYDVNPDHSTYRSDGYNYTQPFPNMRLAYKLNDNNKLSVFYNHRVDRPNEVDIRIFPKYDDAEIIKVGNPALSPQFTNSIELGYKTLGTAVIFIPHCTIVLPMGQLQEFQAPLRAVR